MKNAIFIMKKYLRFLAAARKVKLERAEKLKEYEGYYLECRRYANGNAYYSVRKKGDTRFKYVGDKKNPLVAGIMEVRYIQAALLSIDKNMKLVEDFLRDFREIDYESVNALLPKLYKNAEVLPAPDPDERARRWKERNEAYKATFEPYRPEELKYKTEDGIMVRSVSEALIYNLLLSLGITFIYELPLKTNVRTFYPDFTILSEVDYNTVIIIEHQRNTCCEDKAGAVIKEMKI